MLVTCEWTLLEQPSKDLDRRRKHAASTLNQQQPSSDQAAISFHQKPHYESEPHDTGPPPLPVAGGSVTWARGGKTEDRVVASFAVWSRRASRYTHRKSLRSKSLKTHSAHSLWEILWNLSFNPSLLWCHLKTTNISAMFENRKHFFFSFSHWHVKRIALKSDVIENNNKNNNNNNKKATWKNILFAGASVHHSAQKFYRPGQWRG